MTRVVVTLAVKALVTVTGHGPTVKLHLHSYSEMYKLLLEAVASTPDCFPDYEFQRYYPTFYYIFLSEASGRISTV